MTTFLSILYFADSRILQNQSCVGLKRNRCIIFKLFSEMVISGVDLVLIRSLDIYIKWFNSFLQSVFILIVTFKLQSREYFS